MKNHSLKFKLSLFFPFFVVILIFSFLFLHFADAATNISVVNHWAWNDVIGWIDFYTTGNVNVTSTQLSGYASSSVGYISLDCNTSPSPDCTYPYKISNDGNGNLSGWAWNDAIGWISFDSATATSSYFYQVVADPTTGDWRGWAWNDIIGWMSFNCSDTSCASSNYKVSDSWFTSPATSTLISSVFDTGSTGGVALNTVMWQGSKPAGTNVQFQIASMNANASGTGGIDSVYHYAWNDSVGWIDFGYSAGNVNVVDSRLIGYAYNNSIKEIALDCATAPGGSVCNSSNFGVNRAANGDLSGYAWNDSVGWISFNCSDPGICGTSSYKVNVSTSTGAFSGYAWNDYVGWISFNCLDPGLCGSSTYRVNTTGINSWYFIGPDGSGVSYYTPTGPNVPLQINLAYHNNMRYFRYKVFLQSDSGKTVSPRVDDVIINYSP